MFAHITIHTYIATYAYVYHNICTYTSLWFEMIMECSYKTWYEIIICYELIIILQIMVNWREFFLDKCIFSIHAQNNSFYNSINKLHTMPQMFYGVISALHWNVIVGPRKCIILGVTIVEHTCSSFSIKNDNGSEVYSPVNSNRGIREYYNISVPRTGKT